MLTYLFLHAIHQWSSRYLSRCIHNITDIIPELENPLDNTERHVKIQSYVFCLLQKVEMLVYDTLSELLAVMSTNWVRIGSTSHCEVQCSEQGQRRSEDRIEAPLTTSNLLQTVVY